MEDGRHGFIVQSANVASSWGITKPGGGIGFADLYARLNGTTVPAMESEAYRRARALKRAAA